jgi:hypothetical protein
MKRLAPLSLLVSSAALLLAACDASRERGASPATPFAATLSTNETIIGRPFFLRASVSAPEDAELEWPTPGHPPALWVRNSREERSGGRRAREWEMIALRPGRFPVWTGSLVLARSDGSRESLDAPRLEIAIRTTLTATNREPRDISGLERWPDAPMTRLLMALAVVTALALAAALVAIALRRRKASPPPVRETPPHERALRAIRALRARGIPGPEGVEPYYVELSAIVRRYLEDAFALRAPEQTTEEFIRAASTSHKLTLEHQQLVAAFLEQSDLVKFARHLPAPSDMEAALAAAERLVCETIPRPAPEPSPPAAT